VAIAIIPARSGSQRIPNKNIKEFRGKPMIRYAVEAAERSGLFNKIYISSDNPDYAKYGGGKVIPRTAGYERDEVGTQDVMRDALMHVNKYEYTLANNTIVCCIYPTVPLMAAEDLHRARYLLQSSAKNKYAFSVGTNPLSDAGQFYMGYAESFLSNVPLISEHSIMVPISEDRVCDINTMEDFHRAEMMFDKLHGVNNG